jgi:hypothetical protein
MPINDSARSNLRDRIGCPIGSMHYLPVRAFFRSMFITSQCYCPTGVPAIPISVYSRAPLPLYRIGLRDRGALSPRTRVVNNINFVSRRGGRNSLSLRQSVPQSVPRAIPKSAKSLSSRIGRVLEQSRHERGALPDCATLRTTRKAAAVCGGRHGVTSVNRRAPYQSHQANRHRTKAYWSICRCSPSPLMGKWPEHHRHRKLS